MVSIMQLKVNELAKRTGVSADTVRFYTRQGLLHPARDPQNSYQLYDHSDLQRLNFVQKARKLGFSLKDIQAILHESQEQHSPCPMVREMFEDKLEEISRKIEELQALRQHMQEAMDVWHEMPDGNPDGHTICRLIEHWEDNAKLNSHHNTNSGRR